LRNPGGIAILIEFLRVAWRLCAYAKARRKKKRFTAAAVRIAEIAVHLRGSRKSLFPFLDIGSPVITVESREAKSITFSCAQLLHAGPSRARCAGEFAACACMTLLNDPRRQRLVLKRHKLDRSVDCRLRAACFLQ